jgi:uncharacterized membrane protein YqhA
MIIIYDRAFDILFTIFNLLPVGIVGALFYLSILGVVKLFISQSHEFNHTCISPPAYH